MKRSVGLFDDGVGRGSYAFRPAVARLGEVSAIDIAEPIEYGVNVGGCRAVQFKQLREDSFGEH